MSTLSNEARARQYADRVVRATVAKGFVTAGTPEAKSRWADAYIRRWRQLNDQSTTTGPVNR